MFCEDILKLERELLTASRDGIADQVEKLIRNAALDVNNMCGDGKGPSPTTPLYEASLLGHINVVRVLLENVTDKSRQKLSNSISFGVKHSNRPGENGRKIEPTSRDGVPDVAVTFYFSLAYL